MFSFFDFSLITFTIILLIRYIVRKKYNSLIKIFIQRYLFWIIQLSCFNIFFIKL